MASSLTFNISENAMGSWLPQQAGELHPLKLRDVNCGVNHQEWRFPLFHVTVTINAFACLHELHMFQCLLAVVARWESIFSNSVIKAGYHVCPAIGRGPKIDVDIFEQALHFSTDLLSLCSKENRSITLELAIDFISLLSWNAIWNFLEFGACLIGSKMGILPTLSPPCLHDKLAEFLVIFFLCYTCGIHWIGI
ncbi:hypothetical protein K1719_012958 [Acacia pycnantha]|nr:hypothetical protein K1719_012958 [Acacia pycnantha]